MGGRPPKGREDGMEQTLAQAASRHAHHGCCLADECKERGRKIRCLFYLILGMQAWAR